MDRPKFISICNQKGGVGKSNFTAISASYLCYEMGYNVAVFDCDYPQYSIKNLRDREIGQIKTVPFYNRMAETQFERLNRSVYPVLSVKPSGASKAVNDWIQSLKSEYDVILFDMPGTVNNIDVLKILDQMDYLFVPIIADRNVMESSLEFAYAFKKTMSENGKKDNVHLFWNMVDGREKNNVYEAYEEIMQKLSLPVMKSRFPLSARFRKEAELDNQRIFRSTVFPVTKTFLRGTSVDIEGFSNEICSIIQLNNGK